MPNTEPRAFAALVEDQRVHKSVYTDDAVYQGELDHIFHKKWIYVGHESQVPNPGDYWTTWIGKERVILSRDDDGRVHVLYNRCPHRGTLICNAHHGNAGKAFRCPYHAWQFHMDGSVRQIPMKQGYDGVIDYRDPQFSMVRTARPQNAL